MPAGKKRHSLPKNLSQLFATKNGWYIKMYHYTGFHPVNHDKVKKITKDSYCKSPRHVLPTLFTKEGFSSPQSYFHRLYRGGWSEAKVPNDRGRCQPLLFWSRTRRTYDVEDWGSLIMWFLLPGILEAAGVHLFKDASTNKAGNQVWNTLDCMMKSDRSGFDPSKIL